MMNLIVQMYEYNNKPTEIMLVPKSSPASGLSGYAKQERERDPFSPAIPTESFALIHAALPHPWEQLNAPPGSVLAGIGLGKSTAGGNQWPALPEHTPLYSAKSVSFMASWLSANMPLKAPLKGSILLPIIYCSSNTKQQKYPATSYKPLVWSYGT
jgi:hypothetical protein